MSFYLCRVIDFTHDLHIPHRTQMRHRLDKSAHVTWMFTPMGVSGLTCQSLTRLCAVQSMMINEKTRQRRSLAHHESISRDLFCRRPMILLIASMSLYVTLWQLESLPSKDTTDVQTECWRIHDESFPTVTLEDALLPFYIFLQSQVTVLYIYIYIYIYLFINFSSCCVSMMSGAAWQLRDVSAVLESLFPSPWPSVSARTRRATLLLPRSS